MAATNSVYASAPTVFMQPNPSDQYFASSHYIDQNGHPTHPSDPSSSTQFNNSGNSIPATPLAETPGSLAGTKRSRGDRHDGEDEDVHLDTHESSNAGKVFELGHMKRPSVTSRKSQRVLSDAASPDHLAQLVLPAQIRDVTTEALIDKATHVLGVSWTRMDSSEARQINQAAYSKWIQNHYSSLKDVAIWFEYGSEEIPAYLVKAHNVYNGQQEFYIFSNDLVEARLVTREPDDLIPRLSMMPALHLAAPGGQIHAKLDSVSTSQEPVTAEPFNVSRVEESSSFCAAHAMEMD
jgi:hypothetical protein